MEYVLITGATSGIGYALSEIYYRNGYALILVGRSIEKLQETKRQLEQDKKMNQQKPEVNPIHLICQDLALSESAKLIYNEINALGLKVDIVINNAGAGYVGEFVEEQEADILSHMHLNMMTLTLLTRYFAQDMKQLGKGKILNVASTGAYHPGPYTAVYYATKAYVLSLTEALYEELKDYGVHVASLCPGATKTNFACAAGREDTSIAMTPEFVAQKAYVGMIQNKKVIIPGIRNKLWVRLSKRMAIPFIKVYQRRLMK